MCLISVSSGQAVFRRSASLLDFGEGSTDRLDGPGEPLEARESASGCWAGLQVGQEAPSGGARPAQDPRPFPRPLAVGLKSSQSLGDLLKARAAALADLPGHER